MVVEGFIHLQQFHAKEIARGLAGVGGYVLWPGFPAVTAMPQSTSFVVAPQDIVSALQTPAAEVLKRSIIFPTKKHVFCFCHIHISRCNLLANNEYRAFNLVVYNLSLIHI